MWEEKVRQKEERRQRKGSGEIYTETEEERT